MRWHKRTTRNIWETLTELMQAEKQVMSYGVARYYEVSVNYLRLNKTGSVVRYCSII